MGDFIGFCVHLTVFSVAVALTVRLYLLLTAAQRFLEAKTQLVIRQNRNLDTE